jgi:hypothetical protein
MRKADEADVEITYYSIKRETPKAILFEIDDQDVWLPRSQIVRVDEHDKVVQMSAWIAGEKGFTR